MPTAINSNNGRRFADGVYETVELLAASYVADGKSIPAAARLTADQLVNNHPGLADELAAEAASGQGGLGDGVVRDIAERSSESAIKRGSEVDGGLPDFDVAETSDGNLEVRRMDGEVRGVSVEELGQLQALADEIVDAGEAPSEDLVNDAGNAVRRLLPGVEQRLTDKDAFLALRLAADPRELEIVTEALTRGEAPPPMLRTAASPVQWLVTVGVPALLKVLRTLGRTGTKRKRPRRQSEEDSRPDMRRRPPVVKPRVDGEEDDSDDGADPNRREELERARRETKVPEHVFDSFASGDDALNAVSRLPKLTKAERQVHHAPLRQKVADWFAENPTKNKIKIQKHHIAPGLTDGDAVAIFSELAIWRQLTPDPDKNVASLILGPIDEAIVDRIKTEAKSPDPVGDKEKQKEIEEEIDLERYVFEIPHINVYHARRRHGVLVEARSRQDPVEVADLSLIQSIWNRYGEDDEGLKVLKFYKKVNGTIIVVSSVRHGRRSRSLAFASMRKFKKGELAE